MQLRFGKVNTYLLHLYDCRVVSSNILLSVIGCGSSFSPCLRSLSQFSLLRLEICLCWLSSCDLQWVQGLITLQWKAIVGELLGSQSRDHVEEEGIKSASGMVTSLEPICALLIIFESGPGLTSLVIMPLLLILSLGNAI